MASTEAKPKLTQNDDTSPKDPIDPNDAPPKGLIYPPLDIKKIVDRTAEHVAKSGEAFQQLIRDKYEGNVKFSFIYPKDPYFAYYEYMVTKYKEGKESNVTTNQDNKQEQKGGANSESTKRQANKDRKDDNGEPDQNPVDSLPEKPPSYQFTFPMPAISAQDLDVIKLTAQFAARNGRQFQTMLAQRESANYQFDFLSPNHTLHQYFTQLVNEYKQIFFPSEDIEERLHKDFADKFHILDRVNRRMKWTLHEEEENRKRLEESDREREEFLSIDWHDFVVVGTVEFVEEDAYIDLPPPLRHQDLKQMSLEDKRKVLNNELYNTSLPASTVAPASSGIASDAASKPSSNAFAQYEEDDDDIDMEDEDDEEIEQIEAEPRPAAPLEPVVPPMKIRKDYVPNLRRGPQTTQVMLQCQLCKEQIPASEFEEHIRVELIDPKWKEQKLAYERRIRDSNLVHEGMDVAKYLQQMATHRSDIFGGNEKQEESRAADSSKGSKHVVWDGYLSTAGKATKRARENLSVEEQINAIYRKKGLLVPPKEDLEVIGPQLGPSNDAKRQRANRKK